MENLVFLICVLLILENTLLLLSKMLLYEGLPDWAYWTVKVGSILFTISGLILVFKGFIFRD